MTFVRDYIIKRYESKFNAYKEDSLKTLKEKNTNLLRDYEESVDIPELLASVQYWHGTGRFQYSKLGKSKYEGASKTEKVDVLQKIIAEKGLVPQYDPWFERYVKTPYSLSLANQWFYGKMYAHFHQDEHTKLAYEIAPISFWFKIWFTLQLTERYGKIIPAFLVLYVFSHKLQEQAKKWLSTFRSDTEKKWPFWKILTAKSDIEGNYPILFAIKSDIVTLPIMKLAQFFETRTPDLVPFEKVAFIAVPQAKVDETHDFLKKNQITTDIIPLEHLELHMSRCSLKEIVYGSVC